MELTFHTAELREICEKRTVAATELGYSAARELAERLADIEAAETVTELCELLGAAIWDKNPTEKAFRLGSTFEVTLVSGHSSRSAPKPQAMDWKNTTRVKIIAIEPVNG